MYYIRMTIERVRVERIKAKITSSWLRRTSSLFLRNSYIFPKVLNLLRILSGLLLKFLINLFSELTYLLFYTFFNFFINNCTNLFSNVCWQFLELDFVLILFVGSHFIIRFKYLNNECMGRYILCVSDFLKHSFPGPYTSK